MHLTIHCDGGSRGNPGFGYGSYEIGCKDLNNPFHRDVIFSVQRLPLGDKLTNNQAEYLILLEALKKAVRFRPESVEVWTDSQLLVKQVNDEWKCKNWELRKLRYQAKDLMKSLNASVNWNSREVSVEKFGH